MYKKPPVQPEDPNNQPSVSLQGPYPGSNWLVPRTVSCSAIGPVVFGALYFGSAPQYVVQTALYIKKVRVSLCVYCQSSCNPSHLPHWGCSASKNRLPSIRSQAVLSITFLALSAYHGCVCLFDAVLVNLASMFTLYGISHRFGFN